LFGLRPRRQRAKKCLAGAAADLPSQRRNIHIGRALLLTRYGDSIAALAAQLDRLINSDTLVWHISQRAESNRRIGNLSRGGDPSQGHRPLLQRRSQLQIVGISLGQRHFQVERLLPPATAD